MRESTPTPDDARDRLQAATRRLRRARQWDTQMRALRDLCEAKRDEHRALADDVLAGPEVEA